MKNKKISFCTTHMKRIEQISQTLPVNLADNQAYSDFIEFVLVDFIIDGDYRLFEFVNRNMKNYIDSKYLRYYHTSKLKNFHAPICKNTTHRLSSGDVIVNLDCDNYTGKNGGNIILDIFKNEGKNVFIHQESNNLTRTGSCGRICYYRNDFFKAGGYDESFFPCGHHDRDIMTRLIHMGIKKIKFDNEIYNKAIRNTKLETIKNVGIDMSYSEMVQYNKSKSLENISNGKLVANLDKDFIGVFPL